MHEEFEQMPLSEDGDGDQAQKVMFNIWSLYGEFILWNFLNSLKALETLRADAAAWALVLTFTDHGV